MTKKKITKVQEAYKKERRRIQNYLNKKFKQGFYTTQKILPAEPKKVTEASVNRLKKITAKDIVKKLDRKSTRLNSSHSQQSRMPSSA